MWCFATILPTVGAQWPPMDTPFPTFVIVFSEAIKHSGLAVRSGRGEPWAWRIVFFTEIVLLHGVGLWTMGATGQLPAQIPFFGAIMHLQAHRATRRFFAIVWWKAAFWEQPISRPIPNLFMPRAVIFASM